MAGLSHRGRWAFRMGQARCWWRRSCCLPRRRAPGKLKTATWNEGRFAYEGLDRVIHERARLSVLPSLITNPKGLTFGDLKQLCALTDGNLSRHLRVLERGKMVEIMKGHERDRSTSVVPRYCFGPEALYGISFDTQAGSARCREGKQRRIGVQRDEQTAASAGVIREANFFVRLLYSAKHICLSRDFTAQSDKPAVAARHSVVDKRYAMIAQDHQQLAALGSFCRP